MPRGAIVVMVIDVVMGSDAEGKGCRGEGMVASRASSVPEVRDCG